MVNNHMNLCIHVRVGLQYFDNTLNNCHVKLQVVPVLNISIIQNVHHNTSSNENRFYSLGGETMNSNIINTLATQAGILDIKHTTETQQQSIWNSGH